MTSGASVAAIGPVSLTGGPKRRQALYGSGYALVLSSGLTSAIGFLFWIVAAREYSQEVVGNSSALLYSMMFLAGAAQLNLPNVLVRFVPVAGRRTHRLVITAYVVGGGLATVVGVGFAAGAHRWSPELAQVLNGWSAVLAFGLACGMWAIFVMQDGVLTAVRRAWVVLSENLAFSVIKLGLVIALAGIMATSGITVSWIAATVVIVLLTNLYLFARVLKTPVVADRHAEPVLLRGIVRYVGGNYLAMLFWLACTQLLPVLVLTALGPVETAVFSMAWTIAVALYLVPAGMGQSLVAYTSVEVASLEEARRGIIRRAFGLLVPVVAVLGLAAPLVLSILGPGYAEGTWTLRLAALSALPYVIISTAVSAARVQNRVAVMVAVLGSLSTLVIVLSLILMPIIGIAGVGLALLTAHAIVAGALLVSRASWLPRPIVRPFAGLRDAGLLARVAPAALAPLCTARGQSWRVQGRLSGRSDTATGMVGPRGQTPALLKVAESSAGRLELARETTALNALHDDTRLGEWRVLAPRILSSGASGTSDYVVENNLPGRDARDGLPNPDQRERFVAAAMATLMDLHRRTAHVELVDDQVLDRWVLEPAARLGSVVSARHRPSMEILKETLTTNLRGRQAAVGWCHGNYTPENILIDGEAKVTGVVGWGQADSQGLLVADAVALLLATEAEASGHELGEVVRAWLASPSPPALVTLTAVQRALDGDQFDLPTLVLFGWLQMMSGNLAKSTRYAANPVWLSRNVYAVLRALDG
jgi:O-antigen/teichoic acid export membrane protein/aminoglycoside phosphotransferase